MIPKISDALCVAKLMAIFLTGSTGYIGAHILSELLGNSNDRVNVLVRAKDQREAEERLWHAMQLAFGLSRNFAITSASASQFSAAI